MSHFSTVESKMKDLECILEAIKDLGMECVHSEKADISIKVSGKYDVGIRLTENGCELLADWWGVEATRGVNEQQFTNQLQQRYAYHKVVKELKAKHYTLDMNEDKTTNVIKLTATKWG